jgi:hypothetical protein
MSHTDVPEQYGKVCIRDFFLTVSGICIGLTLLQSAVPVRTVEESLKFLGGLFALSGSIFAIIGKLHWGPRGAVAGLFLGGFALPILFMCIRYVL